MKHWAYKGQYRENILLNNINSQNSVRETSWNDSPLRVPNHISTGPAVLDRKRCLSEFATRCSNP